ncbi:hypothetical protein WICMUC_001071 [Wickerhamomyces mucosus]|uniref:Uncharacterized protein n=1 Tax=Wickerhamomyces mucosus TaxID=1378264 RepID=A0A9P8PVZ3_9ASCO|nr:hypothetical protein WICMUC_001071 [Wickerhamomyces mucosus]
MVSNIRNFDDGNTIIVDRNEISGENKISIKPPLFNDYTSEGFFKYLSALSPCKSETNSKITAQIHIINNLKRFQDLIEFLKMKKEIFDGEKLSNSKTNEIYAKFLSKGSFGELNPKIWGYRCYFSPIDCELSLSERILRILPTYWSIFFFFYTVNIYLVIDIDIYGSTQNLNTFQFLCFERDIILYINGQDFSKPILSNFMKELDIYKYGPLNVEEAAFLLLKSFIDFLKKSMIDQVSKIEKDNWNFIPRDILELKFLKTTQYVSILVSENPNSLSGVIESLNTSSTEKEEGLLFKIHSTLKFTILDWKEHSIKFTSLLRKFQTFNKSVKSFELTAELIISQIMLTVSFYYLIKPFQFDYFDRLDYGGCYHLVMLFDRMIKARYLKNLILGNSPFFNHYVFNRNKFPWVILGFVIIMYPIMKYVPDSILIFTISWLFGLEHMDSMAIIFVIRQYLGFESNI